MGAVFGAMFAGVGYAAEPVTPRGFELLFLNGQNVKWGEARLGAPATVRYAFLSAPKTRAGARNCRTMRPITGEMAARWQTTRPEIQAEFRFAFDAWQRVAAIRFVEAKNVEDADLLIGIQARGRGIAFADVIPEDGSQASVARIRKAAICLNPDVHWKTTFGGARKTYDVQLVALHEIGHVLGLDHSRSETWRVMDFRYRELARVPQAGDAAGAVLLYGRPAVNVAHRPEGASLTPALTGTESRRESPTN